MEVRVIASGSTGNCTLIDGAQKLLLDVGITKRRIDRELGYELPAYALLTHEHSDHANKAAVKELLERGVEVYMTAGTKSALELKERYNLRIIGEKATIGDYEVTAYKSVHDAKEPVCFSVETYGRKIYYITDTGSVDFEIEGATDILIEANHTAETLRHSRINEWQKARIRRTHLSLEKCIETLKRSDLSRVKNIELLHISGRHGCRVWFERILAEELGVSD